MSTAILTMAEYAVHTARMRDGFMPAARRGLKAGAQAARTVLVRESDRADPASERGSRGAVNYGRYRAAWTSEVITDDKIRIENAVGYAGVIEGGRRAGARPPPRAALAAWAMRKMHLDAKQAQSVGFLIARAIAKRGLQPRRVMAKSIPQIVKITRAEILRAVHTALTARGH